jgi:aldose 1-epimerase
MPDSTPELATDTAARANQPPSGQQHVLVAGRHQAVVVELGGGVKSYTLGGRPVLDGYAEQAMATAARGQPLLPWPNRVRDGRYAWDGVEHRLALTEPEKGNALHGLVRWANWTATDKTSASVTMQHVLHPQPGYPFALELAITYSLSGEGLEVSTSARNVGSGPAPYACGQHPYLAVPRQVDDCHLHLPAATYLPTDD